MLLCCGTGVRVRRMDACRELSIAPAQTAQAGRMFITMLLSLESSPPDFLVELSTHTGFPPFPCPSQRTPAGPPIPALGAAAQDHQECLQHYIRHTRPCVRLDFTVHLASFILRLSLLLAAETLLVFLQFLNFSLSLAPLLAPSLSLDPKDWHLPPRLSAFLAQVCLFYYISSTCVPYRSATHQWCPILSQPSPPGQPAPLSSQYLQLVDTTFWGLQSTGPEYV